MFKNPFVIISLLLFFAVSLNADVAPDAGFVRVSVNLVTETKENLKGYKFFLDFYGDLREVEIISHGRTEIPPPGGGARYSSGTLLAIHRKELDIFGYQPSVEQTEKLAQAIKNRKITAVEIAKHRFSMDVPKGEKPAEVYYVIKLEENMLKSERIIEEKPGFGRSAFSVLTFSRASFVVAGIFTALAVLATGVFAFRKASKKV